ncbi:MAG: Ribonuclease Y [Candidatus Uhrbacteria bacterium GW2011_GWE2_40_58]|nr:MAG: Ribonuclease Y [Candidatus Uhrbacteria bacterium GW2011_GWF2_40_263]KKR67618.1 MAG: Ribonuclease Y [Candidatus Uhrbacteria bacterium GW2011_GWE2_40_58]HBK34937.1 ribonuclease Y [Candidatus Uhrbacteria bacterium]HCB55865.1 ribonuclease Y [Candidatus Uhrbacteria bacterium]
MFTQWILFLTAVLLLAIGVFFGFLLRRYLVRKTIDNAETRAEQLLTEAKVKQQEILQEAKNKRQEVLLDAKSKAIQIIDESKRDEKSRRRDLQDQQHRLEKRETMFDQKLLEFEDKSSKLETQLKQVEEGKQKIREVQEQQLAKLQEIAGLTQECALDRLLTKVETENQEALMNRLHKLELVNEEELEKKSRNILSLAMVRYAAPQSVDTTTSIVELPSDEMKGRIIGKEGRNIKAIELLTGTEIIVDDTPEMITISGFSPIRRQVAKRALEVLIKDGRIHPARIEDAVMEAKKTLAQDLRKTGEDALYQLGIPVSSIDPKMVSILGRLKYRTSYGQNALQHSIEVGLIAGMMAEELGADATLCKKGGLFHDIGKAVDHDMQGAHPEIGYNIMKKFGFPEEVCYQSVAHHEDAPKTVEGVIIKAADAISGARPGARKQSLEQFIQRMEELEKTASAFEGVNKAYAIQAGREVRVFVQPEQIDDLNSYKLAKDIATKIEAELSYPGEVKVTVIRETRVIEYAR